MHLLPIDIDDIFQSKISQYRYFSVNEMDNRQSMDWFIDYCNLYDFIEEDGGTQIVLANPNYSHKIQVDAGGLGDFCSHKFDITCLEK